MPEKNKKAVAYKKLIRLIISLIVMSAFLFIIKKSFEYGGLE